MTDQSGRPFTSQTLDGKVWIANFIFTRCTSICQNLSMRMAELQRRTELVGDSIRLVSFTVDPSFDTAERLAIYGAQFDRGPRWTLLTGSFAALEAVVVHGMAQVMGRADGSLVEIAHRGDFLLVDRQGAIRGHYRASDPGGVDALIHDALALARDDGRAL